MYTREQVEEATLKYFGGDELATSVWINKYCLKNNGEYLELTPDDMHRRLAKEFARIESKYMNALPEDIIYGFLKDFAYIVPQGSPMAGIGNPYTTTSLSNCFVIGNHDDSYGGIMRADEEQAQLMKCRGGVGQDISHIRPSGAIAGGSPLGGESGATLYMHRYSNTTREVQQDGRRGALMLSIDALHPDAEAFIDKKTVEGAVTGANVSVRVGDEFLSRLANGTKLYQRFPCHLSAEEVTGYNSWDLPDLEENVLHAGMKIDGVQTYFKIVDPQKLWQKIVQNAWKSAEPGILFWDNIINESPAKGYGPEWKELSTNPCGEIPLPDGDSCRLLAVNLLGFAYKAFSDDAQLDDRSLRYGVKVAMRLMDDIVDLEIEKVDRIIKKIKSKKNSEFRQVELALWKRIRQKAVDGRRTGLGITAESDLMAALGIKYGTKEGTEFSEKLHQLIATTAYQESISLAAERGAFPIWDIEKDRESRFLERMFGNNELMDHRMLALYEKVGRRNIGVLTIAPTGSLSILAQVASGIEPAFALWYFRQRKAMDGERVDRVDEVGDKWLEYPVIHKPFIEWFSVISEVDYNVAKFTLEGKTAEELEKIYEVSPWYGATSRDVDYVEKVRMQGAVQKWVDHSISVTVNMPEDVTEEMVSDVYNEAVKVGCKGITIYRENSRGNVLSTTSIKDDVSDSFEYIDAIKREKEMECDIYFKSAMKEPFIILVGLKEDKPYEVFAVPHNDDTHFPKSTKKGKIVKVKKGQYALVDMDGEELISNIASHMIETEQNETRSISALLRHRVDPKWIVSNVIGKFATINSFHKVIGKVLSSYITDTSGVECPSCGHDEMNMQEGCMTCPSCGYAHCG